MAQPSCLRRAGLGVCFSLEHADLILRSFPSMFRHFLALKLGQSIDCRSLWLPWTPSTPGAYRCRSSTAQAPPAWLALIFLSWKSGRHWISPAARCIQLEEPLPILGNNTTSQPIRRLFLYSPLHLPHVLYDRDFSSTSLHAEPFSPRRLHQCDQVMTVWLARSEAVGLSSLFRFIG